jgi:hypothetical protein
VESLPSSSSPAYFKERKRSRKHELVRKISTDRDNGDAWAWYFKFEVMDAQATATIMKECGNTEPSSMDTLESISKKTQMKKSVGGDIIISCTSLPQFPGYHNNIMEINI